MKAIQIIHAEHRALSAVIQAFRFILDGIRDGKFKPDFALLGAMIEYITEVPDKLHHPKEDDFLFVAVRQRVPASAGLLDKLEADHAEGARRTVALRAALDIYQQAGAAGFTDFETAARRYLDASWNHLVLEEQELLPLAQKELSPEDWREIDAAFEANKDPWAGPAGEFAELFKKIVTMVPAPHGVGPG